MTRWWIRRSSIASACFHNPHWSGRALRVTARRAALHHHSSHGPFDLRIEWPFACPSIAGGGRWNDDANRALPFWPPGQFGDKDDSIPKPSGSSIGSRSGGTCPPTPMKCQCIVHPLVSLTAHGRRQTLDFAMATPGKLVWRWLTNQRRSSQTVSRECLPR
jgi:hypothetical protein